MKDGIALVGCGLIVFVGGMFAMSLISRACSGAGDTSARTAPSVAPPATLEPSRLERKPESKPGCALGTKDGDGSVPVLPTEEGYDEFVRTVSTTEDGHARNIVFRAHGGFWVKRGTACTAIDTGLVSSKIRVAEGPHAGKVGWVPTEWRSWK